MPASLSTPAEGRATSLDLSPCPFCSGHNIERDAVNAIRCLDCFGGVCLEWREGMDPAEVEAAWNRRPTLTEREGVREALLSSVLLEALRFYADPANWQDFIARPPGRDSHYHSAHAHLDKGDRARAAIAQAEARA